MADILVSSEVSHRIARMVNPYRLSFTLACTFRLPGNPMQQGKIPGPLRHMCHIPSYNFTHTREVNYQYPWCDLNVPLVTNMVKREMYFLLPWGAKKMPEDILALEMSDLDVLSYLDNFAYNSAVSINRDWFKCWIKRH